MIEQYPQVVTRVELPRFAPVVHVRRGGLLRRTGFWQPQQLGCVWAVVSDNGRFRKRRLNGSVNRGACVLITTLSGGR